MLVLVALGHEAGTRWELPIGRTVLGRSQESDITVEAVGVSRRHCLFIVTPEGCLVKDLDSHNGTLVNGQAIREQHLVSGDEVRVGERVFRFEAHSPELDPAGFQDDPTVHPPSVSLSLADLPIPQSALRGHDLRTILRFTTVLHSFRALKGSTEESMREELAKNIAALLVDLFNARAAAVLDGSNILASFPADAELDQGVVQAALSSRTTVLSGTAMAAPIVVADQPVAVLYVASRGARYSERSLELLGAVAVIATAAWESGSLIGRLLSENNRLQSELSGESHILGESPPIREILDRIARAARANTTVLIMGESGTGKELVARAIHAASQRESGPFVAINCAALTESLLESELFGYEKGAFTGAYAQRKGKLEAANGGTLFLDEIGEMPLQLQSKLLRVLQERELERVGGTRRVPLDVRVLAATNRNLEEAVERGQFRGDLYYRLNVIALRTPALRDRREDILPLAEHFARRFGAECGRRISGISAGARVQLQQYAWPGNVRELQNAIERAVVLGGSDIIEVEDLPETVLRVSPSAGEPALFESAVQASKRQVVLKAFQQAANDHDEAARLLGLHPNYLHRLIRSLDLRGELKRAK